MEDNRFEKLSKWSIVSFTDWKLGKHLFSVSALVRRSPVVGVRVLVWVEGVGIDDCAGVGFAKCGC